MQPRLGVPPRDEHEAVHFTANGNHPLRRAQTQLVPRFWWLFVGEGGLAVDHAQLQRKASRGK
jgi:hypothetical protein